MTMFERLCREENRWAGRGEPSTWRWPTVRELAKGRARAVSRGYLDGRSSYVLADLAYDLVVALEVSGEDVRWLKRFCWLVREEAQARMTQAPAS